MGPPLVPLNPVTTAQLPEALRQALDPAAPLPAGVTLLAQSPAGDLGEAYLLMGILGLGGFVGLLGVVQEVYRRWPVPASSRAPLLLGFVVCLALTVGCLANLRYQQRQAAARKARGDRHGILLAQDFLLYNARGQALALVPRACVQALRSVDAGRSAPYLALTYKDVPGQSGLNLDLGDFSDPTAELVRKLRAWLAG